MYRRNDRVGLITGGIGQAVPLGRGSAPDAGTRIAAFFVSDESSYVIRELIDLFFGRLLPAAC